MKKLSLLVIALPLLITACNTACIEDAGVRVEHVQSLKEFDELEVRGPIKVIIQQDSSYKVRIAADSNVVDEVKASVSGGTLKLKLDSDKYCGSDSVVIYAGIKLLKKINLESGSKLQSTSLLNLRDVEMNLNGTTQVDLQLTAGKLTTTVDGTAKIALSGQAGEHILNSTGALSLNAFDFVVARYNLHTEGVNASNINVLNDLNVETSGTSETFYKGSPVKINKKKAGTAKLEKVN
ncbi:head GIN domain-containing protein [Pedobacter sp.]|uniref:head GIN domain-containing protein n=1 Tax=Pedobacter sp. TaxID=1411316 RepID=UPI003D7F35E5